MTDQTAGESTAIEYTKTLTLRNPVMLGKEGNNPIVVTELNLREPTADEIDKFTIKAAASPGQGAMILLIALVSGVPEPAVRKIGQSDIKAAMRFLIPFVSLDDVFPATGEKSSPT